MFQIRIQGCGGKCVVTGAAMLSKAAILEDRDAQAFSSLGCEQLGAPTMAFCRVADSEFRLPEPVLEPVVAAFRKGVRSMLGGKNVPAATETRDASRKLLGCARA